MNSLIIFIFNACLARLVFAALTLEMERPGPYFAGSSYNVVWTNTGKLDQFGKKFHIVQEDGKGSILPAHIEVDTDKTLSSTGAVSFVFVQPGLYNVVAFDKDDDDKDKGSPPKFSGEIARLRNPITVLSADSQPQPNVVGSTTSPETSSVGTSPSVALGPSKSGLSSDLDNSTRKKANNTAIIVGGVLGAAIAVCILIIVIYIVFIRPRLRKRRYASEIGIFIKRSGTISSPQSYNSFNSTSAYPLFKDEKMHPQSAFQSPVSSPMRSFIQSPPAAYMIPDPYPTDPHLSHLNVSPDTDSKKTYSFPSIFTDATPPVRLVPLTDRQMDLQEQIHGLKAQLIPLNADTEEFDELMERIQVLEGLMKSDWALDRTDEIPPGLI